MVLKAIENVNIMRNNPENPKPKKKTNLENLKLETFSETLSL